MTGKTTDGPREAPGGPESVQKAPGGELVGRGGDSGVQAASGASGWTQLEARAFNAVGPAVQQAGQWLPLSARRAVANAVLAELKRELDALAQYEHTINWMTTCTSCARVLDSAYAETIRRERAEATIARVQRLVDEYPVGIDTALLEAALDDPPPAHNDGPSVREAARNDRRWPLEKAGE